MKTNIISFTTAAFAVLFVITSCNQPTTTVDNATETTDTTQIQPAVEEQNKQLARDWFDAFNARDYEKLPTFFADNYVYHPDESVRGPQGALGFFKMFIDAFDAKLELVQLVAEDDRLCYHIKVSGKHIAPFQGVAPTNKEVNVNSIGIVKIENGKITEEWEVFEELKMMQQLGLAPSPEATTAK